MPQLYFDNYSYNIIIVIALILVPALVNVLLNKMYNKLSMYRNSINKDGKGCIDYFVKQNNLKRLEVYPSPSAGYLDHYVGKKRMVFLNWYTYSSYDVASFSKVIYLAAPEILNDSEKNKLIKLDFIESIASISYIVIGPGLLWFGLLFKINVLIYIGLAAYVIFAIYHLTTYHLMKKRINKAYEFICRVSTNENEKFYINKIYQRQKIIYLLGFFLESCKLFNMFLPKNMKKLKIKDQAKSK